MAGIDRYLQARNGIYRVRVRVPDEVRPVIGRLELLQSLGTGSKTEARKLAPAIVARFLAQIASARPAWTQLVDPFDPLLPIWERGGRWIVDGSPPAGDRRVYHPQGATTDELEPAPRAPQAPAKTDSSFTAILALWALEHPNPDTFKKYTRMMRELAEDAGTDDGNKITPQQIVAFETKLRQAGRLDPNTIGSYLTCFNSLFRFAKRKFVIDQNPMADVKVPGKIDSNIQPYTTEQVQRIVREAQALRTELFLMVVVQAYSGVRISEIANRRVADIRQEDGVWCLSIPTGKTKSSERIIPLHSSVLKRLLPYREAVIEKYGDEGFLFPELPRGSSGKPSVYATRELCRWVRKDLGIADERIQPDHSFRHYCKSKLLKAGVDVKIRDMLAGHGVNVARKYEHGDIEMMAEAIGLLPDPLQI